MGQALSAVIQQPPQQLIQAPRDLVRVITSCPSTYTMWQSFWKTGTLGADRDWETTDHDFNGPRTPSTVDENHQDSGTDSHLPGYENDHSDDAASDDDYEGATSKAGPKPKKGGYDSRIEQILYENPQLPILIVDAGKSNESGGKYIVYTIRTGVCVETGKLKRF
jgi:hypothetical protein